jgi:hypothetical protein
MTSERAWHLALHNSGMGFDRFQPVIGKKHRKMLFVAFPQSELWMAEGFSDFFIGRPFWAHRIGIWEIHFQSSWLWFALYGEEKNMRTCELPYPKFNCPCICDD